MPNAPDVLGKVITVGVHAQPGCRALLKSDYRCGPDNSPSAIYGVVRRPSVHRAFEQVTPAPESKILLPEERAHYS